MTDSMGSLGAAMKGRMTRGAGALLGALSVLAGGCGHIQVTGRASLGAQVNTEAMCASVPPPALWHDADQRAFRQRAKQGPVVVSQEGCHVRVLPACEALGVSSYTLGDTVPAGYARSTNLNARAALGVVGAGGDSSGKVSYQYFTVAHHDTSLTARVVLQGDCQGATHVVKAYSTGASQLMAHAAHSGSVENEVIQGQVSTSAQLLATQGDLPACQGLTERVDAPPCSAVVDLDLVHLSALCAGHNCAPDLTPPYPPPLLATR